MKCKGVGSCRPARLHSSREEDAENGATATMLCTAANVDPPAVLLYDAVAEPQAKARARVLFGGEKWFENVGHAFGRDSGAVVRNGYAYSQSLSTCSFLPTLHAHTQATPLWQCLNRVTDQVRENLAHLSSDPIDLRYVIIPGTDFHFLYPQLPAVEVEDFVNYRTNVDGQGGGGITHQAERLLSDAVDTTDLAFRHGDIFVRLTLVSLRKIN